MPRKFSDAEREAVRGDVILAGRALFSRYGYQKTSMDEVARAAGIGKGTVYLFFPSKEDLLFALIRQEYGARDAFLDRLERADAPTAAGIRRELGQVFDELADSPLLTALFGSGQGELVSRTLSETKMAEHDCDDERFVAALLDVLRRKGFRPRHGPEVVMWLFHIVWLSLMYRSRMREEGHAVVNGLLLDLLCDELTGAP